MAILETEEMLYDAEDLDIIDEVVEVEEAPVKKSVASKSRAKAKAAGTTQPPPFGVLEVTLTTQEVSDFFNNYSTVPGLDPSFIGYFIIMLKDPDSDLAPQPIGVYKRDGDKYCEVPRRTIYSSTIGDIRPKKNDLHQVAYIDSLHCNHLTFATGPAGTGKSLIALAYAFQQLERGKVSKIVIFVNPCIAESAVKLGFLPGTKVDKLLETSIGSILVSKLGGESTVRDYIYNETIVLMPVGDCRGYEVPQDAFVYFTEAQNTDVYLMKLFLQRTTDDCTICVEGDIEQTDTAHFAATNGLARAAEVFRGEDYAAHVNLVNIYRGKVARKAEEM